MEDTTAIRRIDRQAEPSARCERSKAKPAKERTRRLNRNGFLNHRFLPFWQYGGNKTQAEREFKHSLSNLCGYYRIDLPEMKGPFPQNIYSGLQMVIENLKAVDNKLSCIIAEDDNHVATLATVKRYDTGMTLYYIPVRPLWQWMQSGEAQKITDLLLCVFAYLAQVVRVPYYTEQDTYLSYQYQTLEEWVNDDQEEEEYRKQQLDELYTMQNSGLKVYAKIILPDRLAAFESVVQRSNATEAWEQEWLTVATAFLQLYQRYPNRSVFDHIQSDLLYPEGEDRIRADQYISFYWSGNDCFQDCLFEMIDNHFQEIAYMDEPMHITLFDGQPENAIPDFDFETRLFDLIDQLSRLLNQYDHEQCEPTVQ